MMSRFKAIIEHIEIILAIATFATMCYGIGAYVTAKRVPAATQAGPSIVNRVVCAGDFVFKAIPYKSQPDWLHDHVYWLEAEGDRYKTVGKIAEYMVVQADYEVAQAINRCKAILRVDDGYTIESQAAFRLVAGGGGSFDRRPISVPSPDLREISIDLPESNAGDRIMLIFRLGALAGRKVNESELRQRLSSRFE